VNHTYLPGSRYSHCPPTSSLSLECCGGGPQNKTSNDWLDYPYRCFGCQPRNNWPNSASIICIDGSHRLTPCFLTCSCSRALGIGGTTTYSAAPPSRCRLHPYGLPELLSRKTRVIFDPSHSFTGLWERNHLTLDPALCVCLGGTGHRYLFAFCVYSYGGGGT